MLIDSCRLSCAVREFINRFFSFTHSILDTRALLSSPSPPPRSLSYANEKCSGLENALTLVGAIACVAGVNVEGQGEQERRRKMGDWGLARTREKNRGLVARDKLPEPHFSPAFSLPFPVYAWLRRL